MLDQDATHRRTRGTTMGTMARDVQRAQIKEMASACRSRSSKAAYRRNGQAKEVPVALILVVDDSLFMRTAIKFTLTEAGFEAAAERPTPQPGQHASA